MIGDKLTLDDDDGAVWLVLTSSSGFAKREPIRLRAGFGREEVQQALLATTAVRPFGDELRLTSEIGCERLRDLLEAMLAYFDEPGRPGAELLEIQSAIAEYDSLRELRDHIPLYAYAWLDVMVREDLADDARSANRIWRDSRVVIDVSRYCDRRVSELVARFSLRMTSNALGPMAPSVPTRTGVESRAKIG